MKKKRLRIIITVFLLCAACAVCILVYIKEAGKKRAQFENVVTEELNTEKIIHQEESFHGDHSTMKDNDENAEEQETGREEPVLQQNLDNEAKIPENWGE